MSDSATDDILARSKLLRQRIEARKNLSPTVNSPCESSGSKATLYGQVANDQSIEQNESFPLLITNAEDELTENSNSFGSFLIQIVLVACLIPLLPILPFVYLIDYFKQIKFKEEYDNGILNPKYLRGTGLMVYADLSAELITEGEVPRHVFEKEDITGINHHTIRYGLSRREVEIRIYLHEFHALTLCGFTGTGPILEKLVSLYGVEVHYSDEYVETGGGGGGGG